MFYRTCISTTTRIGGCRCFSSSSISAASTSSSSFTKIQGQDGNNNKRPITQRRQGEAQNCIEDGNKTRAIVLILGFGGAKRKHVAKYASMYTSSLGCSSVVYGTASNHSVFVDHNELDEFAFDAIQEVAKLIRSEESNNIQNNKEIPIVMHILSNGGAFVTAKIGQILDTQSHTNEDLQLFGNRLKIGVQIFDSAPCYMDSKANFTVIKHLLPSPFIGIPAALLFTMRMYIYSAISKLKGELNHADSYWEAWLDDTNCNRQGFIYSEKDDIANSVKIEEFIKEREKRIGVHNVRSIHFEDSVHVQHLRFHREEYINFVDSILTDMEEDNNKISEKLK